MKRYAFLLFCFYFLVFDLTAQTEMPHILSMQERADLRDQLLEERIANVLPQLMRRAGIDMWVLISREYNEDPVLKTLLPATWLSARRRTILVFYDRGAAEGVEALAIARYNVGSVFQKAWDKKKEPDQWKRLMEVIEERQPKSIGINRSEHFGLADGIVATDYDAFMAYLPENYKSKVKSAENLAIGWLETRTEREMIVYKQVMRIAHQIIAEGLSKQVIQPGYTTTADLGWWYRDRIRELGLIAWFHPIVDIQRADPNNKENERSYSRRPDVATFMPGDLIHIDLGITYLGLNTDTQENAYILKAGETAPPKYLVDAYTKSLRMMDILTEQYKNGTTGNEMLANTLRIGKAEGLRPMIYTHPIGYHGHGAGPTIGLWDQQGGVPVKGDYPLYPNTAYSIELNNTVYLDKWGKEVRIMLEEDGFWDGETFRYIDGRQMELFLVPRPQSEVR
ncbi:MAG: M24 family metallopeptidase [Bacteroidota bacterium]